MSHPIAHKGVSYSRTVCSGQIQNITENMSEDAMNITCSSYVCMDTKL